MSDIKNFVDIKNRKMNPYTFLYGFFLGIAFGLVFGNLSFLTIIAIFVCIYFARLFFVKHEIAED